MATKKKGAVKNGKKTARRTVRKAAPPVDHEAMMAAWQTAMTPSKGHAALEVFAGSWRTKTTFTMAPGAPPDVSEGTSESLWTLGGRYLRQVFKGSSMGMPFEGLGYTAYDNVQKQYLGFWMDTFGTGFMTSVGVGKPKNGVFKSVAEGFEPSGHVVRFDCVVRVKDRNHHTYEMWSKSPSGKKYCSMRIEYSRA
jgi:hypothetical protein